MKPFGIVLMVLGTIIIGIALLIDTTASVDIPSVLGYGLSTTREVFNLGKLQTQMLTFNGGGLLLVVGSIFATAGHISEQLAATPVRAGETVTPTEQPANPTPVDLSNIARWDDMAGDQTEAPVGRAEIIVPVGFGLLVLIIVVVSVGISDTPRSTVAPLDSNIAMDNIVIEDGASPKPKAR